MATNSHLPSRGARRGAALVLASLAGAVLGLTLLGAGVDASYGTQGTVARVKPTERPTVQAAFQRQSYKPGQVARLVLFGKAPRSSVRIFRAGTERSRISARDLMLGTAVSAPMRVAAGARSVSVRIGAWPSGLYFARVDAAGDRVGFAPFVLRPSRLGVHEVAIVLPTLTWQAYNFRDDDADGDADSWYAQGTTARLGRPFENRGVPPHYKYYDQPFLRWLIQSDRNVDYLAQSDLETSSGAALASAYAAIVFPGHHEYVTEREYDAVEAYRDRGGNLMFLSANNFFYKVVERGGLMHRVAKWRDLGRPEAALVGVQYIGNDYGEHRGPWVVRNAGSGHWIFAGTGAKRGSSFSNAGIEIDHTASSSPRGTQGARRDPEPPGAWDDGADDLLRDERRCESLRGRRVLAGGLHSAASGRPLDFEPLVAAGNSRA